MYKKMLVPLDGSELAEVVLPYAREVARGFDVELVLLHVCEPSGGESTFMCQAYLNHVAEIAVQPSPDAPAETAPVKVRGEVTGGDPAEEILAIAGSTGADLILMATHGRSGLRRWVLGSTADKVLRASNLPVWLVKAGVPKLSSDAAGRTLLVPLDGSKYAEAVLPHVRALATQMDHGKMDVTLLRVFDEPFVTADYPFPDWKEHVERMTARFKEEAERYLRGVQDSLADAGLKVKSEVLMGNPAGRIIEYAKSSRPELVVMATHGASGLSRWEYGSIADKVLRGIETPVFMVHPQPEAAGA
jgi:nucleotide-binding universal stress UspA family protein